MSLSSTEFSNFLKHIQSEYGSSVATTLSDHVFQKVENANGHWNSLNDRYSASCQIGDSLLFDYSHYDRGKVDSGEDAIFIDLSMRRKNSNENEWGGRVRILSYHQPFVGNKTPTLRLGKLSVLKQQHLGMNNKDGEVSDWLLVRSLLEVMGPVDGDVERLRKMFENHLGQVIVEQDGSDD
ncbi:hypothetical protein C9374_010572 [Naegleria lovaniensis]|uniref:Uncharacterized protein n=1 Tax=Naegleria lovaniensis TaxID=51637 RepID=A0AA88KDZ0_NAELO|nr:uncharacterized protein C9374_010572 [Naegleria lovaniensis]KAG2374553.1 hypothetical protein C9374_010572 [Naegleria lovaniensis]